MAKGEVNGGDENEGELTPLDDERSAQRSERKTIHRVFHRHGLRAVDLGGIIHDSGAVAKW